MYLFFDGVSSRGCIGLFDTERNPLASEYFYIAGNESLKTLDIITQFMKRNSLSYQDITNIICVTGPGSFTGIRCISLIINTLAFTYPHIHLTPVNWFDMSHEYPLIKSSSKRDLFVKREKGAIIEILQNEDIESHLGDKKVYGDTEIERFTNLSFHTINIDYNFFVKNIELQDRKELSPLYCKKPNIS